MACTFLLTWLYYSELARWHREKFLTWYRLAIKSQAPTYRTQIAVTYSAELKRTLHMYYFTGVRNIKKYQRIKPESFWKAYGDKRGARGRNRTGTTVKSRDFKSLVSTNFTTRAGDYCWICCGAYSITVSPIFSVIGTIFLIISSFIFTPPRHLQCSEYWNAAGTKKAPQIRCFLVYSQLRSD